MTTAVVIGLVQVFGPKGTSFHRILGWGWVVCMIFTAITSFGITELKIIGPFGPLHLLSFWVLAAVPIGLYGVRNGDLWWHRLAMTSVYVGALIAATFLTFLPGRRLHDVVTGQDTRSAMARAVTQPMYPGMGGYPAQQGGYAGQGGYRGRSFGAPGGYPAGMGGYNQGGQR
jgi:uncharacterized membrane protein